MQYKGVDDYFVAKAVEEKIEALPISEEPIDQECLAMCQIFFYNLHKRFPNKLETESLNLVAESAERKLAQWRRYEITAK